MTCKQSSRQLLMWLENELDEATWIAMAQHLEICQHCQIELKQLRKTITILRNISQSADTPPIPKKLMEQIKPHRVKTFKVVRLFITACIAFLIGWHARSIAFTPQSSKSVTVKKQTVPTSSPITFNLTPLPKTIHQSIGDKFGMNPHKLNRQNIGTIMGIKSANRLQRRQAKNTNNIQIKPSVATPEYIFYEVALPSPSSETNQVYLLSNSPTHLFTNDLTDSNDSIDQSPYKILVQVTDQDRRVIRTVHIDTTQSGKILAGWEEN